MFQHRVPLVAGTLAALGLWSGWAAECRAQGTVPELRPGSGYTTGSGVTNMTQLYGRYAPTTTYLPGYSGTVFSPIFMTTINTPGI